MRSCGCLGMRSLSGDFRKFLPGGEVFAEPQRECAYPAGAQEGRHLRFPPSCESPLFPWRVWRRLPTCDRCEIGERQSGYLSVSFSAFSQFTDSVLLHIRLNLRRRGITVPRNSLTRYTARHLRIKRLVQFIFAGPVHYNVLTTCATLLCRACLDEITCVAVMYLTLRIC